MRRWGAALVVAAVAGCGVPTEGTATRFDRDAVPFDLVAAPSSTTTTTTTPRQPTVDVPLFFVLNGQLAGVRHPLPPPLTLLSVLGALAAGPTAEELATGLRSVLPPVGAVQDVRLAGGVATVALGPAFTTLAGPDQVLAVAQVVATLTGQPGVGRVAFTLDGAPVAVPRQDGSLASDSVSRDDYAALLGA